MKRINSKIKTFWGVSEIGFSLMATMETSFFILFLTDAAKLPLPLIAVITGFSGIADAVSAILAGIIIDKVNFRAGKYRPWLIYCPPIVVVFFILMFTKIGGDSTAMIFCSLGYIVSHAVWNICWTANRAMIGILSDEPTERAFLSGRIAAGSSGGKMLSSVAVPALTGVFLAMFASLGPVVGYTITAAIASLTFTCTYLIHYFITKGYDTPMPAGEGAAPKKKSVTFADMARVIGANPKLINLLIADTLRLIGYYMVAATAAYYAKIVLGTPAAVATLLLMFNGGTFVGSLLSRRFATKLGTKKASLYGTAGAAILLGLLYLVPPNQIMVVIGLFIVETVFGLSYGLTSSVYSMLGTYSEYKTGTDVKGTIMAFSSLAIKLSIAFRGFVIPAVLGFFAYSADAAITPEMQNGIKVMFLLIPAAFTVISAIAFLPFKIEDGEIARMEKEIAERK